MRLRRVIIKNEDVLMQRDAERRVLEGLMWLSHKYTAHSVEHHQNTTRYPTWTFHYNDA